MFPAIIKWKKGGRLVALCKKKKRTNVCKIDSTDRSHDCLRTSFGRRGSVILAWLDTALFYHTQMDRILSERAYCNTTSEGKYCNRDSCGSGIWRVSPNNRANLVWRRIQSHIKWKAPINCANSIRKKQDCFNTKLQGNSAKRMHRKFYYYFRLTVQGGGRQGNDPSQRCKAI